MGAKKPWTDSHYSFRVKAAILEINYCHTLRGENSLSKHSLFKLRSRPQQCKLLQRSRFIKIIDRSDIFNHEAIDFRKKRQQNYVLAFTLLFLRIKKIAPKSFMLYQGEPTRSTSSDLTKNQKRVLRRVLLLLNKLFHIKIWSRNVSRKCQLLVKWCFLCVVWLALLSFMTESM